MPSALAFARTASARGCSLFSSMAAAMASSARASDPIGSKSVTSGFPWVMVPVLSSTTLWILWVTSRASPDLIRIPFSAPFPVPTIMATGVASPSAQGQEITSTAMPQDRANSKSAPLISHTRTVSRAMVMTMGTNTPAILSAILAMGALLELASSTRRMIWEKVVSSPTLDARIRINPALFMVAAMTLSPGFFCTGMLSPVIAASSMLVVPSKTTPSAGTLLPGFTCRISPARISSAGISSTVPSRSTKAVLGAISISLVMASLVFPLERASRYLPMLISARIMTADSKYRSWR